MLFRSQFGWERGCPKLREAHQQYDPSGRAIRTADLKGGEHVNFIDLMKIAVEETTEKMLEFQAHVLDQFETETDENE